MPECLLGPPVSLPPFNSNPDLIRGRFMKNNILGTGNNNGGKDRRRAILNLFLEDNPAFEVCLRNLQDRELADNERIVLKAYEDEPLASQIERHCLNLQSVLFTLSVFPEVKIPEEVLEAFFEMAGELFYALFHLADGMESVSGLYADEINMDLIARQRVPALQLLNLLRGGS